MCVCVGEELRAAPLSGNIGSGFVRCSGSLSSDYRVSRRIGGFGVHEVSGLGSRTLALAPQAIPSPKEVHADFCSDTWQQCAQVGASSVV